VELAADAVEGGMPQVGRVGMVGEVHPAVGAGLQRRRRVVVVAVLVRPRRGQDRGQVQQRERIAT
jgi:hypothetical protein